MRRVADEELRGLYEDEGLTTTAIGEKLSVWAAVVLLWLRDAGITVRKTAASRQLSDSRRVEYQCQRCGKACQTFVSRPRKFCGRGCFGQARKAA